MKVYTEAEYDRLYEESLSYEQIKSNIRGFNIVKASKSQWSEEQYHYADLSLGIELEIVDEQIFLNYNQLSEHCDRDFITAKFYLSGYHSVVCPGIEGIAAEYAETGGHNYLFYLPDLEEVEQYWQGERLKMLRIEIDLSTIRRFATELNSLPKQLQELIEGKNTQRFHWDIGGTTSQMETIIEHIWHHPYQGAIARMYLEGKVLELLALQLSQLLKLEQSQPLPLKLNPKDIDRLYQAKSILQQNYLKPPSVIELAQQVELNRIKLQQGFRQVFQRTPFGYLQSYRLDLARILLQESELTVSTVARRVGYSNVSYFARTFKQKFGITPGQCRSGKNIF